MPAGPLEETCSVPEYDANAERDPAGQQIVTVIGDLRLRYGLHFAPAWKRARGTISAGLRIWRTRCFARALAHSGMRRTGSASQLWVKTRGRLCTAAQRLPARGTRSTFTRLTWSSPPNATRASARSLGGR